MRRTLSLVALFLLGTFCLLPAQQRPRIKYIMPDVGTPGMGTYVEVVAPVDVIGGYGAADGLYDASTIEVKVVNTADTSKLIFSPCLVSWDGRLISCQVFVRPSVVVGSSPIAVPIEIVRIANSVSYASNIDTFYIVRPQTFGAKSGGGAIGSGGGMGTRSRRGAMIVDSMILSNGTYTFDTTDIDAGTAGNQGFLPTIIISQGRIVVSSNATLSASAYGKTGGPGGGGGGGYGNSRTGLVSIQGELDVPLGSGFVGGKSTVPLIGSPGGFGSSSGPNDSSLNGVVISPFSATGRWMSAGPGHPFDSSGQSGGAVTVVTTGSPPAIVAIGGGGNATAAAGSGNAIVHGGNVGNPQIIPLHGGSGGSGGGACDSVGGGGGGGIALYSNRDVTIPASQSRGGRGHNGTSTTGCTTLRGDPAAGGAGGCIIVGGKLGLRMGSVDIAGGSAGVASGTSTAAADSGGAGRFRNDGRFIGSTTVTPNASRYAGPTMDTLTFADSSTWVIRGTGRPGDSISVFLRGERSSWNFGNAFRAGVQADSTWQTRVVFPFDSVAYIFAIQRCSVPNFTNSYARVPQYAFSQAASSVVKLSLLPAMNAPTIRQLDTIICPVYHYDTITVNNRGTGPLMLGGGTFLGSNNTLYSITTPTFPDTIPPLDSAKLVYRFNGTTSAQGSLGTTLRLITNDPATGRNPFDIAINLFRQSRRFVLRDPVINIGGIYLGVSKDTGTVYRNLNDFRDTITSISILAGPSIITQRSPLPLPHTNNPNDSTAIQFTVTPRDTGTFTVKLKVTSKPCDMDTVITITGYGRSGVISAAKAWTMTGQSCNDTAVQTFAVGNTGNAPLTLNFPTFDPAGSTGFTILYPPQSSFPLTIAQHDSVVFTVRAVISGSAVLLNRLTFLSSDSLPKHSPFYVDLSAQRESASLETSDSAIDLGTLCIGDLPLYGEIRLRNAAQQTTGQLVAIDRADSSTPFTIAQPLSALLPMTMAPHDETPIGVRFAPTQPGTFVDTLIIRTSPCDRVIRIPVHGVAVQASLLVDAATVAFGDVRVGTPVQRKVTIRNGSPTPISLTVDLLAIRPPDPQVRIVWPSIPPPRTLQQGDTIQVTLEYTPSAAGPLPALSLWARTATPCVDSLREPIEGNGILSDVAASRAALTLTVPPCSGSGTAEDTLSIGNLGAASVDITGITATPANFSVIGSTAFSLAGGASQTVRIRFTAGSAGTVNGTLTISTTDPQRPTITIPLIGRLDSAAVSFSIRAVDFDTAYSCALPARRTLLIHNGGSLPDTVRGAAFPAPFDLTPPPPYIIPPGKDTTVMVTFNPVADGRYKGKGSIVGGPCAITDTVTLSGIRATPAYTVDPVDFGDVPIATLSTAYATVHNPTSGTIRIASASIAPANAALSIAPGQFPLRVPPYGPANIGVLFTPGVAGPIPPGIAVTIVIDSACSQTLSSEIAGQGVEGSLIANRGALSFGKLLFCKSATDSVVVKNSGAAVTTINGVSLVPPSGDFSQNVAATLPLTLKPGDSMLIHVSFAPSAPADGPRSSTLAIATDDPKRPEIDIPVKGERTSQAIGFGGLALAPIPLLSSETGSAWIINTGTAPVTLSGFTLAAPFSVTGTKPLLPATIAPGDSIQVQITFTPPSAGTFTDSLTTVGTDLCGPLARFGVTGTAKSAVVVTASWPSVTGRPGELVTIPLMISSDISAAAITSYTLGARFNKTMLEPTRVVLSGTLSDGWTISSQSFKPGSAEFTANGTTPIAGPGPLAYIEARVLIGDSTSTTIAATDSSRFLSDGATLKVAAGIFQLEGYCQTGGDRLLRAAEGFGLRAVRPNPVTAAAEVELGIVEEGQTQLLLVDLLGRTSVTLLDRGLSPGNYLLSIPIAEVPNGVYFLELHTPTGRDVRQISVAH